MIKNHRPYLKGSAAYSLGMLLYYLLHVFYYNRQDPDWLSECYFILFALPGIISLKFLPLTLQEHTYRHYLKYSFYVLISFSIFCMLTGEHLVLLKRWLSFIVICVLAVSFLALFLKLKSYRRDLI